MDSQRDMYIKEILQKDQLISKKADDIFTNFFNTKLNQTNTNEKTAQEKVVHIDDYRKNRTPKKFMTAVASLAIVLLVGNTYASTQGYENIFFAIKDWTLNMVEKVTKEEILTDREIIISYQNIDITDKTKIQVNELEIKDNEAILSIRVNSEDEENLSKIPMNFIVTDLTNGHQTVIGNQKSHSASINSIFTEKVLLEGFKENTERLKLELKTNNDVTLCTLEIDLLEKQIDIIDGKKVSLKKISEIDLKEKLNMYVGYKIFLDDFSNEITNENLDKYKNEAKLIIGYELAVSKLTKNNILNRKPTTEEINEAIKEFCGEKIQTHIETAEVWMKYDEEKNIYDFVVAGDYNPFGLCLQVKDISFANGEYTVNYLYCRPSEDDYMQGTIEDLPILEDTITFKLNDDSVYTEYCITSI